MKDVVWLLAVAALTGFGLPLWRVPFVRELDRGARLAIAFAAGCVIGPAMMFAFSLIHLHWTRATLFVPLGLFLGFLGFLGSSAWRGRGTRGPEEPIAVAVMAITLILTFYGTLTARETCGDLLFFWGPKGQAFYLAEKIDTAFLAFPDHALMHPDYPPLLPLVYAWGAAAAHRFSWWGALLLMPLALLATALAFRGITRKTAYAALLTAVLGFGFARGMVAGAGEPLLLLFETIALALLTFHADDDGALLVAAIALAGAAWIKVEGAAFVGIALFAFAVTRRRIVRPILAGIPAAILFVAWLAFAKHFGLLDQYSRAKSEIFFGLTGEVVKLTAIQSSYGVLYLPWLAAIAPIFITRNIRRAALPLVTAAGLVAATIFFYIHEPQAEFWIASSAERVLLSPLMALVVASAASSE